jgi:hypothetical protein
MPYVPGLKVSTTGINGTNFQLNLLEADPAGSYDIFSVTDLTSSVWNDISQGGTGQTNFTLAFVQTGAGFYRAARTDTPVVSASGLLVDFVNGFITNNIAMALVNGGPAAATAILVDSTNFGSAVWIPFTSTPLVDIGTNQGTHEVWFGFKGSDGVVYWSSATVTLDTVPPIIAVTNPMAATVAQPVIQLQGWSSKPLSNLAFDISNSAGIWTNQIGYSTGQFYDTNSSAFTTNYFQCFDVPLTNGLNVITLRATDLAGNMTMTNVNITLDYSGNTNAPAFNLFWPQNGDQISGNEITLRGWTDDPTATINASLIDGNGNTNVLGGLVERNGLVWIEDMPLADGENVIAITATDAAGNVNATNITVTYQSSALTIDDIADDQLGKLSIDQVTGSFNTDGYTIWVNGVEATQDGSGQWIAMNVPLANAGTAVVQARAIPDSDNGGNGSMVSANSADTTPANPTSPNAITAQQQRDQPAVLYMANYDGSYNSVETGYSGRMIDTFWETTHFVSQLVTNSSNGGSGSFGLYQDFQLINADGSSAGREGGFNTNTYVWPSDIGPVTKSMDVTQTYANWNTRINTNINVGTHVFQASGNVLTMQLGGADIFGGMVPVIWSQPAEHYSRTDPITGQVYTWDTTRKYTSVMKLRTGGKAGSNRMHLFAIHVSATEYPQLDPAHDGCNDEAGHWMDCYNIYMNLGKRSVVSSAIRELGEAVGSDGNLYIALPDNQEFDAMPVVASPRYTSSISATKYKMHILANGYPLADDRVRPLAHYCVGQQITFSPSWSPSDPGAASTVAHWSLPGEFVNDYNEPLDDSASGNYFVNSDLLANLTTSCWFINKPGGTASIGMNLQHCWPTLLRVEG